MQAGLMRLINKIRFELRDPTCRVRFSHFQSVLGFATLYPTFVETRLADFKKPATANRNTPFQTDGRTPQSGTFVKALFTLGVDKI
jgi:hypothetical protein